MTTYKKVKKVISILQKFEDVQKNQRKRIIYEDEIDGPEYEPNSPTEDEEEEDSYKIQTKSKKRPPKQTEKPKQLKKRYKKSIKMLFFLYSLLVVI